ncbi:hypothetical protein [Cellulosimicrobium aquatile]|uniref:hypothetical protein n=1 Tax=Cellulosimicrobium aquatile TaxID=1612203 RepID=UPI001459D10C|nr:hypothetical protein [Cellulosimicrobium aquatile]NMF27926.1 hypothetical protein [Cellulosimicrobium aquatile]
MSNYVVYGAPPAEARELKREGQARAARSAKPDDRAAVRAAVRKIAVGTWFTVNDLREDLDAAGVPTSVRGSLLAGVAREGLAERAVVRVPGGVEGWVVLPSSGRSAKGAGVTAYERVDPSRQT